MNFASDKLDLRQKTISFSDVPALMEFGAKELVINDQAISIFDLYSSAAELAYLDLAGIKGRLVFKTVKTLKLDFNRCSHTFFSLFPHVKTVKIRTDNGVQIGSVCTQLSIHCPFLDTLRIRGPFDVQLGEICALPPVRSLLLEGIDFRAPHVIFPEELEELTLKETSITQYCFTSILQRCQNLTSLSFIGGSASVEALESVEKYGGDQIRFFHFNGTAPDGEDDQELLNHYTEMFRAKWPGAEIDILFGFEEYDLTMTQEFTPPD